MSTIHFGALVYQWQAIDVIGPFDLLNSSGKMILDYVKGHGAVSQELCDRGPDIKFHYIGEDLKPVELLTSNVTIVPTTTIDNCPPIDFLLLGGPIPDDFEYTPKYVEFIKRHIESNKVVFTTCTGAAALASTGLLDGREATVNNVEYNLVKKMYPKVKWSKDKKWVVDGNIWTGAGAVAGMDMFAHWIQLQYGHDIMTAGAMGLDYEPRDIDGILNVIPFRYDDHGNGLSTHAFPE